MVMFRPLWGIWIVTLMDEATSTLDNISFPMGFESIIHYQ